MLERATRLCRMSPQIVTVRPVKSSASCPSSRSLWRSASASSSACVGCSCCPSPALSTGQSDLAGDQPHRAAAAVADHDGIGAHGVERDRGVDQRFALLHAGLRGMHVDHVGAQPLARDLEAQQRAGGILEEGVDDRQARQQLGMLGGLPVERDPLLGLGEQIEDLVAFRATEMPIRSRCGKARPPVGKRLPDEAFFGDVIKATPLGHSHEAGNALAGGSQYLAPGWQCPSSRRICCSACYLWPSLQSHPRWAEVGRKGTRLHGICRQGLAAAGRDQGRAGADIPAAVLHGTVRCAQRPAQSGHGARWRAAARYRRQRGRRGLPSRSASSCCYRRRCPCANMQRATSCARSTRRRPTNGSRRSRSTSPASSAAVRCTCRKSAGALDRFRAAEKPIYAYAFAYGDDAMLLAAHADEVWVDPMGGAPSWGRAARASISRRRSTASTSTRNVYRVGTYKSAVEPYIRNRACLPKRARTSSQLLATLWQEWRANVKRRAPQADIDLRHAGRRRPGSTASNNDMAKAALAAGLADRIGTRVEWGERVANAGRRGRMVGRTRAPSPPPSTTHGWPKSARNEDIRQRGPHRRDHRRGRNQRWRGRTGLGRRRRASPDCSTMRWTTISLRWSCGSIRPAAPSPARRRSAARSCATASGHPDRGIDGQLSRPAAATGSPLRPTGSSPSRRRSPARSAFSAWSRLSRMLLAEYGVTTDGVRTTPFRASPTSWPASRPRPMRCCRPPTENFYAAVPRAGGPVART